MRYFFWFSIFHYNDPAAFRNKKDCRRRAGLPRARRRRLPLAFSAGGMI